MSNAIAPSAAQAPAAAPAATATARNAKTWIDRRTEVEEFLRSGALVGMKEIPVGVTRPMRAQFAPGGPVAEMAWKPIRPGRYNGYYESYKHEIAAYELDKLLALDMVPPTVEKRVQGQLGAAVLWVSPTRSFKDMGGAPAPPPTEALRWTRQLSRAKMFDNLIANIDPNLGNWLVDPAWNLVLIDHTRSFTTTKRLVHDMNRIDADLWSRMEGLDEAKLTSALGQWLGRNEIKGLLERRDRMRDTIGEMAKKTGEAVFLR